jgi:hypothetical protein
MSVVSQAVESCLARKEYALPRLRKNVNNTLNHMRPRSLRGFYMQI